MVQNADVLEAAKARPPIMAWRTLGIIRSMVIDFDEAYLR